MLVIRSKPARAPILPMVRKARFVDRQAPEPEWKAVHRVADRHIGRVAKAYQDALLATRKATNIDKLVAEIERFNPIGAAQVIPLEVFQESMEPALAAINLDVIQGVIRVLGRRMGKEHDFPVTVEKQLQVAGGVSFTLTNQRAVSWAALFGATAVRDISLGIREAIRNLVMESQSGDFDVRELARRIKQTDMGMTGAQALAAARLERQLILQGVGAARRRVIREQYVTRAISQRAQTIARTESMRAANMGQQEVWMQMADQGLINPVTTRRVWIVTPDDRLCPFCAPMDGQVVTLEGSFSSGDVALASGGVRSLGSTLTPPLHPRCRCALALEFTGV